MNVNRRIHIFIKRQLPPHLRRTRNIFFISFSTSSFIGLVLISAWLYWLGNIHSVYSTLIAAAMVAMSLAIWRYGDSLFWGRLLYQATLMGVVLYNAAITGGVTSPAMAWLAIIPLLPLFTSPRKWALGSMLASLLSVILLYWAQSHGWLSVLTGQTLSPVIGSEQLLTTPSSESMSFAAGMFSLMLLAQIILVQTYDTANEHHLRRLSQTNQRLETLSHNLTIANTHKDQFLAMVSHEMRTPLNAVMGYLDLLVSDKQLHQTSREYAEGASYSASHLLTVINDLLDFSQIQQGKLTLNLKAVNLHDMLTSTHQTLAPRASDQNLTYALELAPSVPTWALVDPHRLTQIIINLLGNALKFTTHGQVLMRVRFDAKKDTPQQGQLSISIEDTGPGIAPESLDDIFKPFTQLKISDNHLKTGNALHGNGLGLAITRSLVNSHKGSIHVSSHLGIGTTFTVTLPIQEVAPSESPKTRSNVTYPAAFDILVVDDHLTNRIVVSATLKRYFPNATMSHAINGIDALEKIRSHRYDLVLMDLLMPDISGTEVVRRIQSDTTHPHKDAPVIGLTANLGEEVVKECLSLGFKDVQPKPFNPEALVNTILTHATPKARSTAL